MEMRVDIETIMYPDGTMSSKGYNLHQDDPYGPPRQIYWGSYMAHHAAGDPSASAGILENHLIRSGYKGVSHAILGQFNYYDNTPSVQGLAQLSCAMSAEFLRQSAPSLKKYTRGYGIWAYRNYRQSVVFNGSFERGLLGWLTNHSGDGSAYNGKDGFLVLSGNSTVPTSYTLIETMALQQAEDACDGGNNNMELCFRCRANDASSMSAHLEILWNHVQVHSLNAANTWEESCLHLPALDIGLYYPFGFRVSHNSSVQIDRVEFFCRK
jgi:hypothetical protein